MKSSQKGAADSLTTAADFFLITKQLLHGAIDERKQSLVLRAAIRIDMPRFKELPEEQQEELLLLYGQAMAANGALSP